DSGKKSNAASATAKPTATASAVPASQIAVTVGNGTTVTGRAADVATALTDQGFGSATVTHRTPSSATTTLTYGTGQKAEAQTVVKALDLSSSHLKQGTGMGLTLVIGADWPSGTSFPGGSSSPAPPSEAPMPPPPTRSRPAPRSASTR